MTLQIPGRSGNGKGGGGRVCIGETELNRYLMPQTEKKANDKDLILFQGMGINTKITAKKKNKNLSLLLGREKSEGGCGDSVFLINICRTL